MNAYWHRQDPVLAIGLQLGLIMLPLYISSLLKKLSVAGKRAEEANRAKNRFLANMSHEMRTPLNGIIGMLDLLKETPLSTEQEELTNTIDDSAHTLLFLMQDVLDLSKIEAGKVSVTVSDFDLYAVVKNIRSPSSSPRRGSRDSPPSCAFPPTCRFSCAGIRICSSRCC